MSPAKRRSRRQRGSAAGATPAGAVRAGSTAKEPPTDYIMPMPKWNWRTFPVYFALSIGLMLGVYVGWVAGFVASDSGNQTPTTVVFILSALLFGFALSRLTTRYMMSKRWIKPRRK